MPPKPKATPLTSHPLGTEIYTTEEVAAALKLSVRHILRAIHRGHLEARKTGKHYLITRDAVRKYWESLPLAAHDEG